MSRIMLILYLAILFLIGGYILFHRARQIAILLYILSAVRNRACLGRISGNNLRHVRLRAHMRK